MRVWKWSLLASSMLILATLNGCSTAITTGVNLTQTALGTEAIRPTSIIEDIDPQANVATHENDPEDIKTFHRAIDTNRAQLVTRMVQAGFNPNVRLTGDDPAIVRAMRFDHREVVMALLDLPQTDVNMASPQGETVLMLAAYKGDYALVKRLVEEKQARVNAVRSWTALHYAAAQGDVKMVDYLLEHGANVNARTAAGVTPLYMAARKPSRAVAERLLEAGAYANWCTDRGLSPADAARKMGDETLAERLSISWCVMPPATASSK